MVREVFTPANAASLTADTVGLQLAEAKDLLAAVQQTLVAEQAAAAVAAAGALPALRDAAPAQGQPRHRRAHPVRHAAAAQPTLAALPVPTAADPHVQPAGRRSSPTGPPRSWSTCRPSSPG